jgi:hypothetical protein
MGPKTLNAYIDYLMDLDRKNKKLFDDLVIAYEALVKKYTELLGTIEGSEK